MNKSNCMDKQYTIQLITIPRNIIWYPLYTQVEVRVTCFLPRKPFSRTLMAKLWIMYL